ncbi:hypothetical protein GPALN_015636 [Globodera pallida]|nr:hypothetical protein GPALN_015636 [Globodera pallida]
MVSRRPLFFFALTMVSFELVWSKLKKPTIMVPIWEDTTLGGLIQKLDATETCKNTAFFCMCGNFVQNLVFFLHGTCCDDGTCACCKTDPQMKKLPSSVTNVSNECGGESSDCKCVLFMEKPADSCCKKHYFRQCRQNALPTDMRIDRKFQNGNSYDNCGNETRLWYPLDHHDFSIEGVALTWHCMAHDFEFTIARMISAQNALSTYPPTASTKFAQPPSSTPSKVNGVAMPPSATYASVVALVLGRFVLLPPMIYGQ